MSWCPQWSLFSSRSNSDESSSSKKSVEAIVYFKPVTAMMDHEYNFLCDNCHGYLTNARMCPSCRYKSCEKCLETLFREKSTCSECETELNRDSLVHIPNLDELDRRLKHFHARCVKLEQRFAQALEHLTEIIDEMTVGNLINLNKFHSSIIERIQAHITEVTAAIDEMKQKLDEQKLENDAREVFAQNSEIADFEPELKLEIERIDEPTCSRLVVPPPKNVTSNEPARNVTNNEPPRNVTNNEPARNFTNNEPARNVANNEPARNVANNEPARNVINPVPAKRFTSNIPLKRNSVPVKRKLPENNVPKKVSKLCKNQKLEAAAAVAKFENPSSSSEH